MTSKDLLIVVVVVVVVVAVCVNAEIVTFELKEKQTSVGVGVGVGDGVIVCVIEGVGVIPLGSQSKYASKSKISHPEVVVVVVELLRTNEHFHSTFPDFEWLFRISRTKT